MFDSTIFTPIGDEGFEEDRPGVSNSLVALVAKRVYDRLAIKADRAQMASTVASEDENP